MNPLQALDKLTLRQPGLLPAPLTGAGPAVVGRGLLGAGLGYAAGTLAGQLPQLDKEKTRRVFTLAGGLSGAASGLPGVAAANQLGIGLTNGTFGKTALDKSAKSSWVGVYLDGALKDAARDLALKVDRKDLAGHGRDLKPHVTVIYGLKTKDHEKVAPLVKEHGPLKLKLGRLSLFTSHPDRDVLKATVTGTGLHRLHNKLRSELPNKQSHGEYRPHMTVAYLKKGTGHKYVGGGHVAGRRHLATKVMFSTPEHAHHELSLGHGIRKAARLITRTDLEPFMKGTEAEAREELNRIARRQDAECCPHCGARLERGDDGKCNRCRKPWPLEKDASFKDVKRYKLAAPAGPETAAEGMAHQVLWADGRGLATYRLRANALKFARIRDVTDMDTKKPAGQGDLVWIGYGPKRKGSRYQDKVEQMIDKGESAEKVAADNYGTYPTPGPWLPASNPFVFGAGHISIDTAADTILADPKLTPPERQVAFGVLASASDNRSDGLITPGDLLRGAVDAGLGYAAGGFVGRAFGSLFGLPQSTQHRMAQAGMISGALRGGGLLR